jgi:hypothetical protein
VVRRPPELDPLIAVVPADARFRPVAAAYLAAQAVLGLTWWALLSTSPPVRSWFELAAEQRRGLDAFVLADLAIFVGGSAASAVLVWRSSSAAPLVVAFTAGGTAYATLYLLAWVLGGGTGGAGLVPMVLATAATTAIAVGVRRAGPT